MDNDLLELYSTGKNRKCREVARNPELRSGFARAVRSMMSVDSAGRYSPCRFRCPGASVIFFDGADQALTYHRARAEDVKSLDKGIRQMGMRNTTSTSAVPVSVLTFAAEPL